MVEEKPKEVSKDWEEERKGLDWVWLEEEEKPKGWSLNEKADGLEEEEDEGSLEGS